MTDGQRYEVAVVGGGPAGLAAALALGRLGLDVALVAPLHRAPGQPEDERTAALLPGSVELMRNLGAWRQAGSEGEAISAIRIIDDTGALLRAPEVLFSAAEVGLEAFGFNVPNRALVAALEEAVRAPASAVAVHEAGVEALEIGTGSVRLHLRGGGRLEAGLVVGADGRNSVSRRSAGIAARSWSYPQSALVCSFTHGRAHGGVSTEFHRSGGPVTTVPLPGRASSLVWVDRPEAAERLARLEQASFRMRLEEQLNGLLGPAGTIGARAVFPLSGLAAERLGARRVALVGEAGHVLPPIGAQGLNLGLRDVAALADCLADALRLGRDPGGPETLEAYTEARRIDVASRVMTVDLLNRSLISDLLPVHLARGLGLHALKAIGPLRRLVVREGLQPSLSAPALMQPGGLVWRFRSSPSRATKS